MSVKLVAAIAFVKVITPSPIVTVPNVELAMSAMIVADAETLEKSMSSPSTGAEPSSQLPPVDILPSFAPPVQVLPATLPTERTSVLPETLQLEGRPSAVVIENFAPSAAVTPVAEQIVYAPSGNAPPFSVSATVPDEGSINDVALTAAAPA